MTRIFVYGTLRSRERNHPLLSAAWFAGQVRTLPAYSMHDLGSFPGVVLADRGIAIVGEVYEVDAETLASLDRLEGHPRFYQRSSIELEDGTTAEAYLLRREQVRGLPVICSGDWCAREREWT
jgi:gamma-glutamylaminecyclotransferase